MVSNKQCEIARLMTHNDATDETINQEMICLSSEAKVCISAKIDDLVKQHNAPIDKALNVMFDDFLSVSNEFNISPPTVFCVYMESKQ